MSTAIFLGAYMIAWAINSETMEMPWWVLMLVFIITIFYDNRILYCLREIAKKEK